MADKSGGLLGATEIRRLADELGVSPTKKLGQNFVHDANTIRRIVSIAGVSEGDHVLEVGPGLGSLTLGLLEAGATVSVIEIDPRLAGALPRTVSRYFPDRTVSVMTQDALEVTEVRGTPTALVANLPYNTSVPITLHLLSALPSLRSVLVMVQAEVAERLAAQPGSKAYGAPSVKARWFGSWSVAGSVPRQVFWPVPNVDSLLVRMEGATPPGDEALRRVVFDLVDHAFATRRKMVRGALSGLLGADRVNDVITAAGLSPEARGEQWTLDDFVALAREVISRDKS
ncbi:MAG: 16S rRNA (adenine(1518)-N(6)/adenine(1519)-N(6))-dimethyltransferase RsmA [Pontimonas sp.]